MLEEWLKRLTGELGEADAPFAVNQIVHRSNDRLMHDVELCVKYRAPIVITSLGAREEVNEAVHSYGGIVLHDVISDAFARKAIAKGADGLIAVAAGAGGHAGTTSPFALIGEIRSWFDGPVALSGAIATGGAVLAAQAMGADFAYIGSAFIATEEANAAPATSRCWSTAAQRHRLHQPHHRRARQLPARQPRQCRAGSGQSAGQRSLDDEFRHRADQGVEGYLGLRPGDRRGEARSCRQRSWWRAWRANTTPPAASPRPGRCGRGRMTGFVLTRALLEAGASTRWWRARRPDMRLLTEAERAQSLRETLAVRPPGEPVWLFGYGSLIWNPQIHSVERRVATVQGWHRAFCLSTRAGRGSPDNPGLVLGLDVGGSCGGVAFRIADDLVEAELALLWRREMLAGSYVPRWLDLEDGDGVRFGTAIAFTVNPLNEQYAGNLAKEAVISRLASAGGELGTSADYLFRTCAGLHAEGILDPEMDRLAAFVAAAQEDALGQQGR